MRKFSILLLTAAMAVVPQWALAAGDFKITVSSDNITGSCADSTYLIEFTWMGTVADGGGSDLVTMIATDEDARAIASDWSGINPGQIYTRSRLIGDGGGINSIVPGKDITVEMFDSVPPSPPGGYNFQAQYDDIAARTEPVALSLTFNPGNCDQELLVTIESAAPATPVPSLTLTGLAGLFVILLLTGGWSMQRRFS